MYFEFRRAHEDSQAKVGGPSCQTPEHTRTDPMLTVATKLVNTPSARNALNRHPVARH